MDLQIGKFHQLILTLADLRSKIPKLTENTKKIAIVIAINYMFLQQVVAEALVPFRLHPIIQ